MAVGTDLDFRFRLRVARDFRKRHAKSLGEMKSNQAAGAGCAGDCGGCGGGLAFLLSGPRGGRGRDPADNVGEVGIRIKSPAEGAGGDGVEDGEGFSVQTLVMTVSCWIADREIVFKRQSFPRSTPGFWDWLGF
jgi:hypothetical protein